jgi:tetratricopeptide (TPR) repeat protein
VELLRRAVDLDPACPSGWVELAEVLRWMGYRTEATEALDSALFMVKQTEGKDKKRFALEYSLERAWLDYEQGDWDEGLDRAEQAIKLEGGLRAQLIAGLNRAATEIRDKDMRESLYAFLPLDTNTNRRRNFLWAYRNWRHLHNLPYEPPDIHGYKEDSFKFPDHEVLRWRDKALIEEANNAASLAVRAYQKSARFHPAPDGDWLRQLEREVPGAVPGFPPMPFWVNPDGGYVTGSLLAYQGYCHDSMKQASEPYLRAQWAHQVIWAGNAAVHRYPYRPWTRLWRGDAFLELDLFKEAENDITYARSWFDEFGIREPALNPVEGHVFLVGKNYNDALPVLEQAAADFPDDAGVWADLGLVRIRKKGRAPSREAFDRALSLDPSLAVVWHNRGLLNLQEKRYAEALADLEKAAELAPQDPQVAQDLARIRHIMEFQGR